MTSTEFMFWFAVAIPVYVYLGYPLLLLGLRLAIPRSVGKQSYEPFVSLLIPAHNEAAVIHQKIRNSLELDYPVDRIEIVIASDGSTDDTSEIAQQFADGHHVRILLYPVNRGKMVTMNESLPQVKGEIVIFSDASAMLMPDAIREIAANFHDPAVGAVSGTYQVRKTEHTALGGSEHLYWRYESFVRLQESALDSVLGGHGHLYAIRKSLYPFPPPDTINDDYVIPVRIVSLGFRAVYEPKAVGWEEAVNMAGFRRRVRIMAGNVQQVRELPCLLRRPLPLFFFLSHKIGRLIVPFAMLSAIVASAILIGHPLYRLLFAIQASFYLIAGVGAVVPLKPRLLRVPYYFAMVNAATFLGIYYAREGGRRMAWK